MVKFIGWSIWYGSKSVEKELAKLLENGFNYLEISLDYPWPFDGNKLSHIISKAKDLGFKVAFHGPWRDIRLASPHRIISKASRTVLGKVIDYVAKYELEYFNVHLISDEITFDEKVRNKVLGEARKTIDFLQRISEEKGITITIENNPHGYFSLPSHFHDLGSLGSLYFCLDVGHAMIAYFNIGERDFNAIGAAKEWINIVNNRILTLHIHDVIKSGKVLLNHYFFGCGIVSLRKLCRFLCKNIDARYLLLELFHKNKNVKHIPEKETVRIIQKNCLKLR